MNDLFLDENPLLDDALIMRLTYDLATRLHSSEVIAQRYGLTDKEALRKYLRAHPKIVSDAKKLHAAWESGPGTEERTRMKFLQATEELIIPIAGLVADPRTPLQARIDGFKQLQRGAGLDGMTAAAKAAAQGEQGKAFNLVINFAGGREQVISGEVVDQVPHAQLPFDILTTGSEDDEGEQIEDGLV